ncbi:MAG TPA: NAD(P)(+) transhydrogenase (Re/Si-specific) subunit beta [Steroidobacteraceae bacterium]|jgi:NAD(P) transhydrogenase subunit beta|nr:NAD(P)(+) transhydrogenase (Re/Si-specific) subunit beta [Steroidobacteraceae bacterium]
MDVTNTPGFFSPRLLIDISYFLTACLFILGLKRMSSPVTARSGIVWAGAGMVVATLVSFLYPGMSNYELIIAAIVVGSIVAWWSGKKVAMTDMPQMIALYNGMGGGAAAAIAAVELYRAAYAAQAGAAASHSTVVMSLAVVGGIIGAISFSGSLIAWAKLQGVINKTLRFGGQKFVNGLLFLGSLTVGVIVVLHHGQDPLHVTLIFSLALLFGIAMTLPIGGADMPVVISLYNALTGLAVAFEGFVLDNAAMIIAGTVVGSAGTLLTQLMAKAMNRSLANVLFSDFGSASGGTATAVSGSMKPIEASDVGVMMAFAQKVIVVPGYGMAVAQAQHKVWEMCQLLIEKGVQVKFAIHPVAGRMPGHMNVLLAEAGVPYDLISDLEEINAEFETADVALVIGANDVVNPVARTDKSSPIYGMPILNADKAKNVIVIKRGQGAGFSGIENGLFFLDNTRMLYGDGQKAVAELVNAIKAAG